MEEIERTLSIVMPDAIEKQVTGEILRRFQAKGLCIVALKMLRLTEEQARGFYAVHRKEPFFDSLVKFMTSGPVVVSVLQGPNAIAVNRELMGPTNPADAPSHTIRADFGTNIERNAVHGSDGPETARIEIRYFFNATELQVPVAALPGESA